MSAGCGGVQLLSHESRKFETRRATVTPSLKKKRVTRVGLRSRRTSGGLKRHNVTLFFVYIHPDFYILVQYYGLENSASAAILLADTTKCKTNLSEKKLALFRRESEGLTVHFSNVCN